MELLAAGAMVLAIVMIVIAARLGRTRANAVARVEALRVLAADAGDGVPATSPFAPTDLGDESNEDWDFRLHAEPRDEVPAPAVSAPGAPTPIRVAPAVSYNRFVVTIPDASSGPRHQVSFERGGN
jgi:hypothetical protein